MVRLWSKNGISPNIGLTLKIDMIRQIYINDEGNKSIVIPTKDFICAGESEPMDHPHVFLTMGNDDFIICPYCGTRYEKE